MAVPFTYFGDLLAIGEAYRRGSQTATSILNMFYFTTFHVLPDPDRDDLRIQMYSDSLTIWGRDCARLYISASSHDDEKDKDIQQRKATIELLNIIAEHRFSSASTRLLASTTAWCTRDDREAHYALHRLRLLC